MSLRLHVNTIHVVRITEIEPLANVINHEFLASYLEICVAVLVRGSLEVLDDYINRESADFLLKISRNPEQRVKLSALNAGLPYLILIYRFVQWTGMPTLH